jgi:hypothetical protein
MAASANRNAGMRQLLAKYGYQIQPTSNAATNAVTPTASRGVEGPVETTK